MAARHRRVTVVPKAAALGLAVALAAGGWLVVFGNAGAGAGDEAGARLIVVDDAFDAAPDLDAPPEIVPVPQRADFPPGLLPLDGLRIVVAGEHPLLETAAEVIRQEAMDRFGVELPVVSAAEGGAPVAQDEGSGTPAGAWVLLVGTLDRPAVAARARGADLVVERPEGYGLYVDADGAFVAGADPAGAFWGVQTLRQLLVRGPQGPALRFARVADWPAFAFRGAMIYLDAFSQGVNDRLIPMLAAYKFNHVLVMANYVKWDATREIWHPLGATKEEARRVADLARRYGLEPIPLIELLGHAQWLFYGGANRDLLHDPECPEPFAYDPLNPRTYEVVLPVLDEAIEIFRPRYVHIGHDEVRNVCRFPATEQARAIGFNRIFVDDVLRLYHHLRSRGVGTMMWQDVAFSEATREEVGELPKDIVFTDWHYQPGEDFPSVRQIREAGFEVIGATWYRPSNAESFARSALRDGAIGMLQTRWTGYFGNPTVLDGSAEQAVAYIRAAASFWNPQSPIPEEVAARRYHDAWATAPYRPIRGKLVELGPWATRALVDPDGTGWVGKGPDYDLSGLVEATGDDGVVRLGPYSFHITGAVMTRTERGIARDLPASVTIPIEAREAALAVLHAAGWGAPAPGQVVGAYTITYQDGTEHRVTLRYGKEIAAWTDLPLQSLRRYPAWRGTTRGGMGVALDALLIENPYPDRVIRSFTVQSESRWTSPAVVGLTLLDQLPPQPPTLKEDEGR